MPIVSSASISSRLDADLRGHRRPGLRHQHQGGEHRRQFAGERERGAVAQRTRHAEEREQVVDLKPEDETDEQADDQHHRQAAHALFMDRAHQPPAEAGRAKRRREGARRKDRKIADLGDDSEGGLSSGLQHAGV
jgi:hypothetical protein